VSAEYKELSKKELRIWIGGLAKKIMYTYVFALLSLYWDFLALGRIWRLEDWESSEFPSPKLKNYPVLKL
jgi:hypothetical protein